MQKRNALLRLRKTLLARWRDRHEKLAEELANLCDFKAADHTGDSADVAFETSSDEMSSQLAELDAQELSQIERALARMKQGAYGVCENCERKITLARLNALPYATLCISCERLMEPKGSPMWAVRTRRVIGQNVVERSVSGTR
jgi:DnaK suppressor protein